MAKSNWSQMNKDKEKYYQYKSRTKKFVLEMANLEDLEDLEKIIKDRKEELKMLYFWYYGDERDTLLGEVKDLKKAIRDAHNYYDLRQKQNETSINQIFIIKKEDYKEFDKENGWIGDIAHFCYDVTEIEKYKKYVYNILAKYYDKNEFEDIKFKDFYSMSLNYNIKADYNLVRNVEIYYVDYLNDIIEEINDKFR